MVNWQDVQECPTWDHFLQGTKRKSQNKQAVRGRVCTGKKEPGQRERGMLVGAADRALRFRRCAKVQEKVKREDHGISVQLSRGGDFLNQRGCRPAAEPPLNWCGFCGTWGGGAREGRGGGYLIPRISGKQENNRARKWWGEAQEGGEQEYEGRMGVA